LAVRGTGAGVRERRTVICKPRRPAWRRCGKCKDDDDDGDADEEQGERANVRGGSRKRGTPTNSHRQSLIQSFEAAGN
jgi:hypothetical protein